ncbi:outer membrane protein assembly factor BamB family protein [Halorhabdus salina]|uniref:outer membrane protein assembly factor BamB family protein n=1 Tax=Halorhabdus salina TaxID=2750670 RepID=UPI001C663002|nr:PQQ-binding-like beta-propeller repeat protein [Halorhabdus salina]
MNRREYLASVGVAIGALSGCLSSGKTRSTTQRTQSISKHSATETITTEQRTPSPTEATESPTETTANSQEKTTVSQETTVTAGWPQRGYDNRRSRYNRKSRVPDEPTEAWKLSFEGDTYTTIVSNRALIVQEPNHIGAFDMDEGERLWRKEVPGTRTNDSLVAKDGIVYYVGRSEKSHFDQSQAGSLVAVDARSGQQQWSLSGPDMGKGYGAVEYAGDLFLDGEKLQRVDPDSKKIVWEVQAPNGGSFKDCLVANDIVYTRDYEQNEFMAFEAASGTEIKRWGVDRIRIWMHMKYWDETMYSGQHSISQGEYVEQAFWPLECFTPSKALGPNFGSDGVRLFDEEGETIWTISPEESVFSGVIADKNILITAGNSVRCHQMENGEEVWSRQSDAGMLDCIVAEDSVLAFTDDSEEIICYR